jgi:hypothetical protein
VNDNNTQMINNLRLEIENDFGWIWSEAEDIDFGLDRNSELPNQGPNVSYVKNNGPSFAAFQGAEPGQINAAPITNDPSEFGNNTLGTFTFSATAFTAASPITVNSSITALNGVTFTAAHAAPGDYLPVTFSDGRIAYFPFTVSGSTAFQVLTLGGVTVATTATAGGLATGAPLGLASGSVWTTQAVGYTNVLDQTLPSEEVTIPLTFTVSVASVAGTEGTSALTAIGGVSLSTNAVAATGLAYGQMAGRNPNFNQGFLDRVKVFQNASAYTFMASSNPGVATVTSNLSGLTSLYGIHQYFYEVILPLKLIHDLFMSVIYRMQIPF